MKVAKYTSKSTQKFQDFILECSDAMEDSNLLWTSVQSNALSDFIEAVEGFKSHLNDTKTTLQEKGFHFPVLSSNLRNSRQISQSSLVRKGNITQANQLTALSSTVNGRLPTLIPTKGTVYSPIGFAKVITYTEFYRTIQHVLDSIDIGNDNWVILLDKNFGITKIKELLKKHTDKKIVCYPSECEQESINNVKDFIEFGCNSILLVERDLFQGCESRNVICMTYDRFGSGEHLRGSLLRAIENLYLIYAFDDGFVYSDVSGFKVDGTFLECGKILKGECVERYWVCKTCKHSFLCTSCKLICHQGHDLLLIDKLQWEFNQKNTNSTPESRDNIIYQACNCNELNMCKLCPK